ncbi:hypothetical protein [Micromonospora inyonensis]|uniref:GDSL-like Lipase/Acylhydrolase family protein n=1 Tax=Micromonospora inyonensis TaxID=47866 RepID=A0A1C6S1S5_9ACTN|nr:hypothetical protein GA0074694_3644 [Micromonospora inyonensis]
MRKSRLVTLALSLTAALGATIVTAVPAQAAATDRYVALGDSYASGVGAGSYRNAGQCSGLQAGVKARAGRAAKARAVP